MMNDVIFEKQQDFFFLTSDANNSNDISLKVGGNCNITYFQLILSIFIK